MMPLLVVMSVVSMPLLHHKLHKFINTATISSVRVAVCLSKTVPSANRLPSLSQPQNCQNANLCNHSAAHSCCTVGQCVFIITTNAISHDLHDSSQNTFQTARGQLRHELLLGGSGTECLRLPSYVHLTQVWGSVCGRC